MMNTLRSWLNFRAWLRLRSQFRPEWRPYLVILAGVLIGLFLLKAALPDRSSEAFSPVATHRLNIRESLGFSILKQLYTSPAVSQPVTSVSVPNGQNCTYSVMYWSQNPRDWPTENILIGRYTFTKGKILALFRNETQDLSTLLQRQFLAAALNLLKGADSSPVDKIMLEASAWISAHPPRIDLQAADRQTGEALLHALEGYNNGLSGLSLCSGNPAIALAQPSPTTAPLPDPAIRKAVVIPITGGGPESSKKAEKPRGKSQPESSGGNTTADIAQEPSSTPSPDTPVTTESSSTPSNPEQAGNIPQPVTSIPVVTLADPGQPAVQNETQTSPVLPAPVRSIPGNGNNPSIPPVGKKPHKADRGPSKWGGHQNDSPPLASQQPNPDPSSTPSNTSPTSQAPGQGNSPGSNPGYGPGNGNGQGNGGGNGYGWGNSGGNSPGGNGKGNGNAGGNGKGKGHGKKP